jgi:hypothetical protein
MRRPKGIPIQKPLERFVGLHPLDFGESPKMPAEPLPYSHVTLNHGDPKKLRRSCNTQAIMHCVHGLASKVFGANDVVLGARRWSMDISGPDGQPEPILGFTRFTKSGVGIDETKHPRFWKNPEP